MQFKDDIIGFNRLVKNRVQVQTGTLTQIESRLNTATTLCVL